MPKPIIRQTTSKPVIVSRCQFHIIEHLPHIGDIADIPSANIPIKDSRIPEHKLHIGGTGGIHIRNIIIETCLPAIQARQISALAIYKHLHLSKGGRIGCGSKLEAYAEAQGLFVFTQKGEEGAQIVNRPNFRPKMNDRQFCSIGLDSDIHIIHG